MLGASATIGTLGKYLGSIPEVAHTYNVVGNVNEHQLTITETTFGGLGQFSSQKGAVIDYGSLIWITFAKSKNSGGGDNSYGRADAKVWICFKWRIFFNWRPE